MRIELIHPMVVHFPVALLLTGAILKTIAFFFRHSKSHDTLLFSARVTLCIGVCFAWVAVVSGEFASGVVKKNLCYPDLLELHETLGYITATLFTVGLLCDGARTRIKERHLHELLTLVSVLLFSAGVCTLVAGAAVGASLVYEQGAAVEKICNNPGS